LKYNVLIIGAGNIGAFYDHPEDEHVITHAHAFCKHAHFNLIGFVDTNEKQARKAAERWQTQYFTCFETAFSNHKIDVVVVAASTEYHYDILMKIAELPIKFVIAEKPLTQSFAKSKEVIKHYYDKNIPALVNYRRRFVPEYIELKNKINNELGNYLAGTGYYGKGILHNGSHMIDLLRYYIGEINNIEITDFKYDFFQDDPSVSGILKFQNGTLFYLNHIDCKVYGIFEIDFFFEKGRVRITESGFFIEFQQSIRDKIFTDYHSLKKTTEIRTQLTNSLYHTADHVYNFLKGKEKIICPITDDLKTLEVCNNITNKIQSKAKI